MMVTGALPQWLVHEHITSICMPHCERCGMTLRGRQVRWCGAPCRNRARREATRARRINGRAS